MRTSESSTEEHEGNQLPAPSITDRSLEELTAELAALGAPAYRARQLFRGVHARHVNAWGNLTDLPVAMRESLAERYRLTALRLATEQRSSDGTIKLLLAASDGQLIETVQIPASRTGVSRLPQGVHPGADTSNSPTKTEPTARRLTICVSSQAGCALACRFCATGEMGFARDLTAGEIVEQVYRAERPDGEREVDNVVFMGMGEPMANYDAVVRAIRILADPHGYGFSSRRVTVSTSGLVPGIDRLAGEGLAARLAISLHAPTDELRSDLMPINRRFPVHDIVAAADRYAGAVGRRVSYEYVMLAGVNDTDEMADRLVQLLAGRSAHVNLIPYNQTASRFGSSPPDRIRAFADRVRAGGIPCTVRASRGQDIAAACGQLKAENRRVAGIRH